MVETDVSLAVESREAWAMGIGAVLMHAASAGLGEPAGAIQWTTGGLAALIGWAALGEQLPFDTIVGFAIVFVGFALMKREEFFARMQQLATLAEST